MGESAEKMARIHGTSRADQDDFADEWAKTRLDRDTGVGEVDIDTLNVHGGSVSLGHPFGATGARMVTTMANELARIGKNGALLGICAAGGIGASAVLERV
jgi:acetyl-CoA acyltransferase